MRGDCRFGYSTRLIPVACLLISTFGTSAWARHTPTPTPSPTPAALPQTITISSPINGATLTANTVVADNDSLAQCNGLSWYDVLYVDGKLVADCGFSSCVFSPSAFSAGSHAIQIHAHTIDSPTSGHECATSQIVDVSVGSLSNVGNEITITAPANGQTVSGSSVPVNVTLGPDVYSDQLVVDGTVVTSGKGNFTWNSAAVINGQHTLTVNVFQQGGSSPIGTASVAVNVNNTSATPAPTPTAAATPTPSPVAHYSILPPGSTLPNDQTCTTQVNASAAKYPESVPENMDDGSPAHWNANNQAAWSTPAYFYNYGNMETWFPSSMLALVDGNKFAGTTQNILRWSACKWGADEDWVYAESMTESGWHQDCAVMHGGTGCNAGGDCNKPDGNNPSGSTYANLSFDGFPVTTSSGTFIGTNGVNGTNTYTSCPSGENYASYGIIQSKVQYGEWATWPMIINSTSWGSDYRWMKWRTCMNNTNNSFSGHFNSSDYTKAVSLAQSNPTGLAVDSGFTGPTNMLPNETNLEYLNLGCIQAHFSGGWYDSISYLTNSGNGVITMYNGTMWPGHIR